MSGADKDLTLLKRGKRRVTWPFGLFKLFNAAGWKKARVDFEKHFIYNLSVQSQIQRLNLSKNKIIINNKYPHEG